jgi:SAM-dependent methyltransferase
VGGGQDGHVQIHEAAKLGFGASAEVYERARPGYSGAAVERLTTELRLSGGDVLVDLGAGTGKLTRTLLSAGATIVAVEPVRAMRAMFTTVLPHVAMVGAAAEALPFTGGSIDAVAVGQAFHWFYPHASLQEIHRVLRPGGRLGLIWNIRDESVPWVAALSRLIGDFVGDGPSYRTDAWRQAFDESPLFGPLGRATFRTEQPTDPEGVVDRVATISFIAALPEDRRRQVADDVRALLASHSATKNRRTLTIAHRTDVYFCDRLGS